MNGMKQEEYYYADSGYYVIHKPGTPAEILAEADLCIKEVLDGTAQRKKRDGELYVMNSNKKVFLVFQITERYLNRQKADHFPLEEAIRFCDNMRRLISWNSMGYSVEKWLEREVRRRYFDEKQAVGFLSCFPECTLKSDLRPEEIYEPLLRFACYAAACYTVYGASCESVTTEHFLDLIARLRPQLVRDLKKQGTGRLPETVRRRKTEHITASANDAFAVIRITAKSASEASCREALEYLCETLGQAGFPHSYSVEFRCPEKIYLDIPGLPKKGVNQLFACAVRYPALHPLMERYARLAMREFEWYANLQGAQSAMPGSFAVFALAMAGREYRQLACDYLALCDDEHSCLQEKFIHAFIKKFGFTEETLPVFVSGVQSMQELQPAKCFAALADNGTALSALVDVKEHLDGYCLKGQEKSPRAKEILWNSVLWAVWGKAALKGGAGIIRKAPENLRGWYQQIFAPVR